MCYYMIVLHIIPSKLLIMKFVEAVCKNFSHDFQMLQSNISFYFVSHHQFMFIGLWEK